MRRKDVLIDEFEEIKILQQYLYMSDNHFIEITNAFDVKLRISMGEDLEYYCKNMNFPDIQDARWSEEMTNKTMLSIISQLKAVPAVEFPERFMSRWEEIKHICVSNLMLNYEL